MSREQIIERLLQLINDSLESHLPWTHKKSAEGTGFHITCVKEYAEMMYLVSKLYDKEKGKEK